MANFYEIDGRHINLDAVAEIRPDYGENWVRLYTTGGDQLDPIRCDNLDRSVDEVTEDLRRGAGNAVTVDASDDTPKFIENIREGLKRMETTDG